MISDPHVLPAQPRTPIAPLLASLVALFKLRIVALLWFSGVGGAFLAAGGWPGWDALGLMCLTGGLAAMGASALNQYLERSADAVMRRTHRRPLIDGTFQQTAWVPIVASLMIVLPSLIVAPSNPALAFWSVLGAVIYVGIYTVWLKPRSVLNIVIGGAAGSCAVLSGSAAVGYALHPGAITLAILIFVWTPVHFWSLAMVYRDDYARAHMPMLPVQTSAHHSAWWIGLHGLATAGAAIALLFIGAMGLVYAVVAVPASVLLLYRCLQLILAPTTRRAWVLFMTSNIYLTIILLMVCVDAMI